MGDIAADRDTRTIGGTLLAVVGAMEALAQSGTSSASLSLAAQGALGFLSLLLIGLEISR